MPNPIASFKRARAARANSRGHALKDAGSEDEAIAEYERACELDDGWHVPLYNLGLIYKYRGDWERSLRLNKRAAELCTDDQASWWNFGIAATALGRWDEARAAWRGAGLAVPDGNGPIDMPCGRAPVRLHPRDAGEVVWTQRLDPARAELINIPFPESGFCFGDVVLNDGAANGYRRLGDQEVPVFDALQLLQASRLSTWVAELRSHLEASASDAASERLGQLAEERGLAAESWTHSIRILCKACSEGRPHEQHAHEPAPARADGSLRIGIAAPDEAQAHALLGAWLLGTAGVELLALELGLAAERR
jgi:tetratricopeptide (TPR) repeat protein